MNDIIESTDISLRKFWEIVKDREVWLCFSPQGCKKLEKTEQLDKNNKKLVKDL